MTGLSRTTAEALTGTAHLAQSVGDILTTPLGSRVMRRDYGSMLFDLIDRPMTAAWRLLVFGATALALARWEPRIRLKRVGLSGDPATGALSLDLEVEQVADPTNARVLLSVPIRSDGRATAAT